MREDSWERNYGRGIMSHGRESWGIHVKLRMSAVWEVRGILGEESWERNHGRGIMGEESWKRNHGRGVMGEESWERNHDRGNHEGALLGEESWERNHESWKRIMGPGSTQEAPSRHPGGTQEAPRRHQGGTQGTQESPGGLGSKNVTKPLCFTIESGATDRLACTKRARPSPSTVNSSKWVADDGCG